MTPFLLSNRVSFMAFVFFAALSQPSLPSPFHSSWSRSYTIGLSRDLILGPFFFPIHTHFAAGLIQPQGFKYNLYANTSLVYISIPGFPCLPLPQELQAHRFPSLLSIFTWMSSLTSQKSKFLLLAAKSAFPQSSHQIMATPFFQWLRTKIWCHPQFICFSYIVYLIHQEILFTLPSKCIHVLTTSYPLCGCYPSKNHYYLLPGSWLTGLPHLLSVWS